MTAEQRFLASIEPEMQRRFEAPPAGSARAPWPGWAEAQRLLLAAVDDYVRAERENPADFHIDSHEAGGQCRLWFPHYRVRGDEGMPRRMREILEARLAWSKGRLFHGYVDCDEVHHEPETFLFFQMPFLFLTGDPEAAAAVVDFAHHVGNWVDLVPAWYDWDAHGFRSTWLGTRGIRDYPPYDYQEANHFRFVAAALAGYVATGDERYMRLAEDYASRWCGHVEALAATGEPIACSILPEGSKRRESGDEVPAGERGRASEYPVFYHTVATNTACEIAATLLDIFRLTGSGRYRDAARALIGQFYAHADPDGRPPSRFSDGTWNDPAPRDAVNLLETALCGQNFFLVRTAMKFRDVTGETVFDGPILRWARSVDESRGIRDQLQATLMMAAHDISGDASYAERGCRMALHGMAATEANREWHQCGAATRYGFRSMIDAVYDPLLAGADYATRGGLPMVGLSHRTDGRRGLPDTLALRCWHPVPGSFAMEAVNREASTVRWRMSGDGSAGRLGSLAVTEGVAGLEPDGEGWIVSLPPHGRVKAGGAWVGRGPVTRRDLGFPA